MRWKTLNKIVDGGHGDGNPFFSLAKGSICLHQQRVRSDPGRISVLRGEKELRDGFIEILTFEGGLALFQGVRAGAILDVYQICCGECSFASTLPVFQLSERLIE